MKDARGLSKPWSTKNAHQQAAVMLQPIVVQITVHQRVALRATRARRQRANRMLRAVRAKLTVQISVALRYVLGVLLSHKHARLADVFAASAALVAPSLVLLAER